MRAVVQRVSRASVSVSGRSVGEIGQGLLVLLSIGRDDEPRDQKYLAGKILNLRIFEDGEGKMNRSVCDAGGALLVISQFTLHGDCRRGHRPSFIDAEKRPRAAELFDQTLEMLRASGLEVRTGVFGASMSVESVNRGPVTILIDSRKLF